MTTSFRIAEDEFRGWHDAVAARRELRGLAAVAKEMEAHLAKAADAHVAVTRHQLFTWAEALQGAHTRDPRAASAGTALSLQQVVGDMRAVLAGRVEPQPPASAASFAAATKAMGAAPAPATPAPFLGGEPVPSVVYQRAPEAAAAAAGAAGATGFVSGPEIASTVRSLIREARLELCIVAPWAAGLDTLVPDLLQTPPDVRILVVSRRPEKQDEAYHRALNQLGLRHVVTAFSPHLATRMVIQDRKRALVGAASIHAPSFTQSREGALVTADPQAVARAKDHFDRLHAEASGQPAPRS